MKIVMTFFLFAHILFAQSISVSADKWQLIGTSSDVNVTSLNLQVGDLLWRYDSAWQYYKKGYVYNIGLSEITKINSGDGVWIKAGSDFNLTIPDGVKKEPTLKTGWNLFSPVNADVNLTQANQNTKVAYAWRYKNDQWDLWQKESTKAFETVKIGEGYWVYNSADQVSIGTKITDLVDGNFTKVTHLSTSPVEDIWNISFKVKLENISNFNIGIKFIKKSSGATGEFVYSGLSLQNGVLSKPSFLLIKGINSLGTIGNTSYSDSYDPSSLRINSISLVGDVMTLKLGTIMKSQTLVTEATFKAISDYNISIVPETLDIVSGASKSLTGISEYNLNFNGIGMSGDIAIQ